MMFFLNILPLQGAYFRARFPTPRDAWGYHIFGFQPKRGNSKEYIKLIIGNTVRNLIHSTSNF
jgi:hypothetical protein